MTLSKPKHTDGKKTRSHTQSTFLNSENFNTPMTLDCIYQIEIELHNKCNVKCPLCSRNNKEMQKYLKESTELPFAPLINALKQFPNLRKVHLVGNMCEPTLYSKFFELVETLKEMDISIMISTNASTMNQSKWRQLGTILKQDDEVRFAIDGSTQERYERYRKGGNLSKVIKNFIAFSDSESFKVLQTIKFAHNESYYQEEIDTIQELCNYKFDFIYDLSTNSEDPKLNLLYPRKDSLKVKLYKRIFKDAKNIGTKVKDQIDCFSKAGFIYINHKGNFITCCDRYEEFLTSKNYQPNIRLFDTKQLLDYLNNIYKDVPTTDICIKHCHKLVQDLEQDRDILGKIKKGAFNEN